MKTVANYLCIGCPLGCRLEVESEDRQITAVRGYSCRRGLEFAQREHLDPRRMLTATVAVQHGEHVRLPVRSTGPVPKGEVQDICRRLRTVKVTAPIKAGDVILPAAASDGTAIVATRDIAPAIN